MLYPTLEICGQLAVTEGAKCLQKPFGGSGILVGHVTGTKPVSVTIIGGGVVGMTAAHMATLMGADVTVLDVNQEKMHHMNYHNFPQNYNKITCTSQNIKELIKQTDLLIGAIFIPGTSAPTVVTKENISTMKPGSVVVDVSVERGGCIETCKPTTTENGIFSLNGVVHYCTPSMANLVPNTASVALNNATLPYIMTVVNLGYQKACAYNKGLRRGVIMANVRKNDKLCFGS